MPGQLAYGKRAFWPQANVLSAALFFGRKPLHGPLRCSGNVKATHCFLGYGKAGHVCRSCLLTLALQAAYWAVLPATGYRDTAVCSCV